MVLHLPYLQQRLKIIKTIRSFLDEQGFWEVDTPALQKSPGLEIHQAAFETTLIEPFHQDDKIRYLHTSPEFAMKKLLVEGMDKIYQIAHAYRNEERGPTHNPEFLMLEFYITHKDYTYLMPLTEDLIKACARAVNCRTVSFQGVTCDLEKPWLYLTVQEAFQKYAGIDLNATLPKEPTDEPPPEKLRAEAEKTGLSTHPSDRWEDIFFRIMLEKVEPNFGKGVPTVLYDYPIALGALARAKPGNPLIAERFEVYIAGVELGNGYSELTDAATYRSRFEYVQKMQQTLYNRLYPIDEDFMDAMERGMPESTGIAIGVDRLIMLLTGALCIQDVQFIDCQ